MQAQGLPPESPPAVWQSSAPAQEGVQQTQANAPRLSKAPVFALIVLAIAVLAIASIIAASTNREFDADLRSASDTAGTEFRAGTDYDLGKTIVLGGWQKYRKNSGSSSIDTTEYELYVMFEGKDNACVSLLTVQPSDGSTFDIIEKEVNDDPELTNGLTLNAIATARQFPSDKRSELNSYIDDVEAAYGYTCTPVYYEFEFITDSLSNYEADKRGVVSRHGAGAMGVGVFIAIALVIVAIRMYASISRREAQLHREASFASMPMQGPQPGPGFQPGPGVEFASGSQPGQVVQPGLGMQPMAEPQPGPGVQLMPEPRSPQGMQPSLGAQPPQEMQPGSGVQPGQDAQLGQNTQPGSGTKQ